MEYVQKAWGSGDPSRFPGPQPVSIERRHFSLLKRQPYLVCEKTDGVRHLLFSSDEGVFIVNRAWNFVQVKIRIPKDTLLDGELTDLKDGRKAFCVYDAVRVKGEDLRRAPLNVRLDKARAVIKTIIKTAGAPFEVRVKTMLPLERIREIPDLNSFDYETDGLVFTPVNEPIRTGTHETMFKWKPRERITVDFYLKNGIDLWVQDRGEPFKETHLNLGNARPDLPDGTVVECGYGHIGWYVEKVRTDKTHANNRRTYHRTIVNLQENIGLQDLYQAI
jgi:ATP-dependent DNA ligase